MSMLFSSKQDILTDFNTKMVTLHAEDDSRLPQAYLGLENMVHMVRINVCSRIIYNLVNTFFSVFLFDSGYVQCIQGNNV